MVTANHPIYELKNDDDMIWWSVDNALTLMDANEIRVAILSPGPNLPMSKRGLKLMIKIRDSQLSRVKPIRERMRQAVRRQSHKVAAVAHARPDRFGFFVTPSLLDAEDAIEEAAYGFDELGADGVFMPTNVGRVYLGDEPFEPLLAELDRRAATIFVHPLGLPCPLISGVPVHVCDFVHSTVRAATNLVQKGAMQRYPNLKIILCHGGGYIPYTIQRMAAILAMTYPERTAEEYRTDYRRFYFDTAITTDHPTFTNLLAFADPTHLVFGSDFPYSQPDMVELFAGQLDSYSLDNELRDAISHTNAERLFPRHKS